MKRTILFILAIMMVFSLSSCMLAKSDNWPETGLASKLPKPEPGRIKISYDYDNSFSATINNVNSDYYRKYLDECVKSGFTIDPENMSSIYEAFNEEGYKVRLSMYSNKISVQIDAPQELGELRWPAGKAGKLIPKVESTKGKTIYENDNSFRIYVGDFSREQFNEYIDKCSESGFNVDYERDDDYYNAYNSEGYKLRLEYEGFNIASIDIEKPKDETVTETEKQTEKETDSKNKDDEPSYSVREMMDAYEKFVDEYVSFMKNYNPSDLSSLKKYMDLMSTYADYLDKLENLKEGASASDLVYINKVYMRCLEKMGDLAED